MKISNSSVSKLFFLKNSTKFKIDDTELGNGGTKYSWYVRETESYQKSKNQAVRPELIRASDFWAVFPPTQKQKN